MNQKFLLLVIFAIFHSALYAQQEDVLPDMVTDRPDATESAVVVPQGYLQIESGINFEQINTAGTKENILNYNSTLLRFGLLKSLELRLEAGYSRITTDFPASEISGWEPLVIGMKIAVVDESGCWPEIGFLGHVNLSAFGKFAPEQPLPDLRFAFGHTLSERVDLGYNIGMQWGEDLSAEGLYSIALGISVFERLGVFVESFGYWSEEVDIFVDGGLTLLLLPNLQLDAFAGIPVTDSFPHLLAGAGVSLRLPR